MQSPFDLVRVNESFSDVRDLNYVGKVARRFFEKHPERKGTVATVDELKAFDEQEEHN